MITCARKQLFLLFHITVKIDSCAEYKIPLVVGLVDYNKAFDSVEIPDVIEALQEQEVDPVYVNVLKHIYKQANSFVKTLNHFKLAEE